MVAPLRCTRGGKARLSWKRVVSQTRRRYTGMIPGMMHAAWISGPELLTIEGWPLWRKGPDDPAPCRTVAPRSQVEPDSTASQPPVRADDRAGRRSGIPATRESLVG